MDFGFLDGVKVALFVMLLVFAVMLLVFAMLAVIYGLIRLASVLIVRLTQK